MIMKNKKILVRDIGKQSFSEAWEYQEKIFKKIINQKVQNRSKDKKIETKNFLIFTEHNHVYTIGKSGDVNNLLIDKDELSKKEIEYFKINRGGDITYHGPGQIMAYPIFDLDNFFTDINLYLRKLEEVIIHTLQSYGLKGFTIKGETGVWVKDEDGLSKKICAFGIRASRWVTMGEGKLIDAIFGNKCEKNFIDPTFITDYPKSMSPLTKEHRSKPNLTERFELIVNGMEIANAYSELNDPIDQLKRFEDQLELSNKGDDEAMFIDMDFIKSLEYGMPPTSGIGVGLDRLVMLMTNQTSIQEVLFFPQMKPLKDEPIISDEAKIILDSLRKKGECDLNLFKTEFDFSNKKWDKITKELRGKDLIIIYKIDENLFIKPS